MKRSFGIWDANAKAWLKYRYYKTAKNAMNGAWRELQWAEVGSKFEVLHRSTFRLIRQYWVTADGKVSYGELYESNAKEEAQETDQSRDRRNGPKDGRNKAKKQDAEKRTIH